MLVVGLNQTIDRTIRLPALVAGAGAARRSTPRVTPGGKAVNVCRAAPTLGHPARLVGPFPGRLGRVAAELLHAEGLDVTAVPVDGEIRGTTVVIEDGGRTTVINEPGPPLDRAPSGDDVLAAVDRGDRRRRRSWPSAAASRPASPTAPTATLIELAHDRGARRSPSTSPAPARRGGGGGRRPRQPQPRRSRAGPRHASGAPVTAAARRSTSTTSTASDVDRRGAGGGRRRSSRSAPGGHGVGRPSRRGLPIGRLVDEFVPAPAVDVVNPIGAGDALLGATLVALDRGRPLEAGGRATASPTPPPPSPTRSPATPTRRWSAALGRRAAWR